MKKNLTKLLALLGVFLFLGAGNASAWQLEYGTNPSNYSNTAPMPSFTGNNRYYIAKNVYISQNVNFAITDYGQHVKGESGKNTTVKLDELFNCSTTSSDDLYFNSGAGNYDFIWDSNKWKLLVRKAIPDKLYLIGTIDGNWNVGNGISASVNNGTYTWYNVNVTAGGNDGYGYLTFTSYNGPEWDYNDNGTGLNIGRYGPSSENTTLSSSGTITVGATTSWKVKAGRYNITVNLKNNTISITPFDTIYVVGVGDGLSWSLPGLAVKKGNDGNFTFKINNLWQFKFSAGNTNSDWNNVFNPNGYTANGTYTRTGVSSENGETINLRKLDTSKDENTAVPYLGNYTVTISGDLSKMTLKSSTPDPGPKTNWVIEGQFKNGNNLDYTMSQKGTSETNKHIWTTAFATQGSGNFHVYKKVEGQNNAYYTGTLTKNNDAYVPVNLQSANQNSYQTYTLDANKAYLFTVDDSDANNVKLYVDEIEVIYMYGHIKGGSWDRGNYAQLKYDETAKKYVAHNVTVGGEWNERDVALEPGRELWGSTGNENYVAFYPVINGKSVFDRSGSHVWKYGSVHTQNNYPSAGGANYKVTKGTPAPYAWIEEATIDNFVIEAGQYDVEFDFVNGTVTFKDPTETNETHFYRWYYGNDNIADSDGAHRIPDDEDGIAGLENEFRIPYGDPYRSLIQVGADDNPKHEAARQVEFHVWYRSPEDRPSANSTRGVKARLTPTTATPDWRLYHEVDGYRFIDASNSTPIDSDNAGIVSTADDVHPITGESIATSSSRTTNHFISLNAVGDYIIVATIPEGVTLTDDMTVYNSTLYATVDQFITPVVDEETLRQAFNPYGSGDVTFEKAFRFAEANLNIGDDVALTITPAKKRGEWTIGDNTTLEGYAGFGANAILDGYYVEGAERVTEQPKIDSNEEYSFKVNVPCSGIYFITLKSTDPNYTIVKNAEGDEATYQIEIYPNLYAAFGDNRISGFYVDQFDHGVDGNESHEVWYGDKELDTLKKEKGGIATATTPGTYFATLAINGSNGNGVKGKRNVSASTGNVNLNNLNGDTATDSRVSIVVTPSKNGASEPYAFDIVTKESETLGVEGIGVEDGEAVYYNLQGVKVQNPEHGIYVKVQNGKAEKVVL